MKVYNIFPLTIYQSKIGIEENEKKKLISIIKDMKVNSKNIEYYNKAVWIEDTVLKFRKQGKQHNYII